MNHFSRNKFGWIAWIILAVTIVYQICSFILAGVVGTVVGGDTGGVVFIVLSVFGVILMVSSIGFGITGLIKDQQKLVGGLCAALVGLFLFFTIVMALAGLFVTF